MKKIYFTVTSDLRFDQRMQRICTSLAVNNYEITLVGRKLSATPPLQGKKYRQKRIRCFFNKGKIFYAEYNIRLFIFLLFKKMDAVCAVDLDTILPCLFISKLKRTKRIYDAHELFSEMKEVITRRGIKKTWLRIEKYAVPDFSNGYTVSESIAEEFHRRYGVSYQTIRNVPVLQSLNDKINPSEKFILYQGAVNEARGLEYLIPAMAMINCKLVICGDGNFMNQLKVLVKGYGMESKIEIKGMLPPEELWLVSQQATLGIALAEKEGLNQFLALPNKFFDYIHAGLPQVTMNYPEYEKINSKYAVAILIDNLAPDCIATALNKLLDDKALYERLRQNCLLARKELNWQNEEIKLLDFYKKVFAS